MEYAVGPVIALLLAMKFTDYKSKQAVQNHAKQHEEVVTLVDKKILESNTQISEQSLKLVLPLAKSVTAINKQLGL